MGYKISFLWNRADQEGFSETYYTSSTSGFAAVNASMNAYVQARIAISAPQVYLYGTRISTFPSNLRQSQFFLNTTNNQYGISGGTLSNNADQGGNGALISVYNQGGGVEQRIFRGIPQNYIAWNPGLSRMDLTTTAEKKLNSFLAVFTSGTLGLGWYVRSKVAGNSNAFKITTVAAGTGNTVIISAPGSAFTNPASGPLILSGFRKPSSVLNGTYGTAEWSVGASASQLVLTRLASPAAVSAYQGNGGVVRAAAVSFSAFQTAINAPWGLVRNRRIGRPFGMVRGRRLVPR
jgi:hypothetical protein